jgi:hypothetical protein
MASDIARTDVRTGSPAQTRPRLLSTETKQAFKTTEFWAYIAVVVGLLVAGAVTKAGDHADDRLTSGQVWLYVSIVTLGYLFSRGLAKSGSRDPYTADRDIR